MKKTLLICVFICGLAAGINAQESHPTVPLDRSRFVADDDAPLRNGQRSNSLKKASEAQNGSTEVSIEYSRQDLSNGYGAWNEGSVNVVHKFSQRQVVYGAFVETDRFGKRDRQAMIGYYQPLDKDWTLLLEANASPTHKILPRFSVMAQLERSLGNGWIAQAGFRRTELDTAKVNIAKLGAEKYWGKNRAAYTLSIINLEETGNSASNRIVFDRYYGNDLSSIGVGFSVGREIENIGNSRILQSDIYNLTLSGKHWFNPRFGIGYGYSYHKQGDIYSRRGLNVGLCFKF
jgi:YaiO family outer membrane protein